MEPIENEPKGWDENQQNNASDFGIAGDKESNAAQPVDELDNDIAGNADGNIPDEDTVDDIQSNNPESYREKTDDPRGFMGDFSEPQHDDE